MQHNAAHRRCQEFVFKGIADRDELGASAAPGQEFVFAHTTMWYVLDWPG
jgi:hypothetical protein